MPTAAAPPRTALSFDRTVDRTLLHRHALAEVFLTDAQQLAPDRYLAAAQLPPAHRYYTDQLNAATVLDPILLLECCRQAETYGGHAFCGVGSDSVFILKRWWMELDRPCRPAGTADPLGLVLDVRTSNARWAAGQLRAITFTIAMAVADEHLGTTTMEVAYLPTAGYRRRRQRADGSLPVRSDAVAPTSDTDLVHPRAVGRELAANVLLTEPHRIDHGLGYTLRLAVDHPSMFDHPQDHVPGVVLTDAARQAGVHLLANLAGIDPADLALTGFWGTFSRYAELDRPTKVLAVAGHNKLTARVMLIQDDQQVCSLDVAYARSDRLARPGALS